MCTNNIGKLPEFFLYFQPVFFAQSELHNSSVIQLRLPKDSEKWVSGFSREGEKEEEGGVELPC